ncbi:MAG: hypothetical protein OXU75_10245 [Deltaproteobacteria bacterium]|nr:hypothetical protein [Deltaproteobacteria bacterium]
MSTKDDHLRKFREAYLDYLEGDRDEPPALEDLPERQRRTAAAFIESITAAHGVDPYASRPSIEQLVATWASKSDRASDLGEALQDHLRFTVDQRALVTPDAASTAVGLASTLVIQARGLRIRVVPETTSSNLEHALNNRAEEIAKVFSAFPDSHAVLYTTTGQEPLAVVVDRGDVYRAIETPSGERRPPRLRRSIADARTTCEAWLRSMIPEFEPMSTDLLDPATGPASALDPYRLATGVVTEVSTAGARARIEAKQATWTDFGDQEAQWLAAIVQEAQHGRLSAEDYEARLGEVVGKAA